MSGASEQATEVALPHACERMAALIADPRCGIRYSPWSRDFGIVSPVGGWRDMIDFCPFCGVALPPSLDDEFFERHPEADEPPWGPDGDRWWREDPVLGAMPLTAVMIEGTPRFDRALHPVEAGVVETLSLAAFGTVLQEGLLDAPHVRATGRGIDVVVPVPPPDDPDARRVSIVAVTDDSFVAVIEVVGDAVVSLVVRHNGLPATTASLPDARWDVLSEPAADESRGAPDPRSGTLGP